MPSLGAIPANKPNLPTDQPLRHAVRRLRWFRSTFDRQVEAITSETGLTYRLNAPKLTRCFIQWLEAFEAQKPDMVDQRQAYVGFASGLMLRYLIQGQPLAADVVPDHADPELPAYFWPEGYAYVMYCLNVRKAVLKEEFGQEPLVSPALGEIRTWHSFKENVGEDPSTAVGFLDLFAGTEPDWSMPAVFRGATKAQPNIDAPKRHSLDSGQGYLPKPE